MKNLAKLIVFTTILGFISVASYAQQHYSVKVVVKGIQSRKGKVYASISNEASNFPTSGSIKSVMADVTPEGEVALKFENMLEGKYAIVLYQDLNDNHQLDMNGDMPAEPFGFSNITMLMGPPGFEQCAFELNENKVIAIGLMAF